MTAVLGKINFFLIVPSAGLLCNGIFITLFTITFITISTILFNNIFMTTPSITFIMLFIIICITSFTIIFITPFTIIYETIFTIIFMKLLTNIIMTIFTIIFWLPNNFQEGISRSMILHKLQGDPLYHNKVSSLFPNQRWVL